MNHIKAKRIGIVTFPIMESGVTPLSNLIALLTPISGDLQVVSGNAAAAIKDHDGRIRFHLIGHKTGSNFLTRIARYVVTQARVAVALVKHSRDVDVWFFFLGEGGLLLPMLAAKLLGRKKTVMVAAASDKIIFESSGDQLSRPIRILERINRAMADIVVVYSPNLVDEWGLQRYRKKIRFAHEHFVDFDKFMPQRSLGQREPVIGFIGRFSKEKGLLNFVKAMPRIAESVPELRFLIVGDGRLRPDVEASLAGTDLKSRVTLAGWVNHDDLPRYLNELKLLVVPSYTEGLANVALEAMACGTPVLATPVGALRDVVKDQETGFVMEKSSPQDIFEKVISALDSPNLEQITARAQALVRREFTFEASKEKLERVVDSLDMN